MEILCPLVGVICLTLSSALSYQLQSDNSRYVKVRQSRSFESRGEGMRKPSFATNNNAEDFSNARFKERKAMKRYSSPSFMPRERIEHRRIEVIPPTHFKKIIQNKSSENNLIDKSEGLSNQRRGPHNSDVLQAIARERFDHRRIEVVAPTIYKKNAQNQSKENHSNDKNEALSNQRRSSHNSDGLQAMPIAKEPKDYLRQFIESHQVKEPKDYVRQFIESHQDILQTKMYEKPSYLAVNVHKAQVTTVPLSLNVRWKFPAKMMSDQVQKVQTVLGADKPMQGENHAADSERKPDGRVPGSKEKDITFREYAKRDTGIDRSFIDPPNKNNHGFSDSLKRYISFKDKRTVEPKSSRVPGAVGIRTDNIEENIPIENPYAIFYKMHQNLDEGFIPAPGGSVEDDSKLLSSKNKQLSANYETKNPNRVMKKFFSFNNNKHF